MVPKGATQATAGGEAAFQETLEMSLRAAMQGTAGTPGATLATAGIRTRAARKATKVMRMDAAVEATAVMPLGAEILATAGIK